MSIAALVILGPLATVILILVLRRWAALLALLGAAVALAAALITLVRVVGGDSFAAGLPGLPQYSLRLVVDPLAALLVTMVAGVSALVLVYAVGYMQGEEGQPRFFATMAFFAAAMQTLVLAGDWILFLVAWELIGLASYLLIGFWFTQPGVGSAATRAFLTTRAADVGLYVGIFLLVDKTGTTAIAGVRSGGSTATVAGLALLLAAMGKSAQVPFQGWLQDAMVGPTPVSALLHSATLVVAGVVLLTRATPLLSSSVLLVIGLIGGVTTVVTGIIATAQPDLKRLLAASTSSQLGLMFLALGAGSVPAAIVHLIANAAIKSSLFLDAGVFQHDRHATAFADLTGVGRARRGVFVAFATSGLALAGVPPLAGFWSKDAIIAAALHTPHHGLLTPLALAGTLLTGIYVGRALRLLWGSDVTNRAHRPATNVGLAWMGAGLGVLTLLAAGLGFAVTPIEQFLARAVPEDATGLLLGLAAATAGLVVGWFIPAGLLLSPAAAAARDGFRVNGGFAGLVARPALTVAGAGDRFDRSLHTLVLSVGKLALGIARAARFTDEAGIDGVIGVLVSWTCRLGGRARRLQSGLVHRELLVAASGAAVLVIIVLLI